MSERINNFKLPVRMRLDSANRTYYTVCSGFWSTLRALLENDYLAQAAFNFVQKGLPEHFVVEAPTVPQAADAAVRLLPLLRERYLWEHNRAVFAHITNRRQLLDLARTMAAGDDGPERCEMEILTAWKNENPCDPPLPTVGRPKKMPLFVPGECIDGNVERLTEMHDRPSPVVVLQTPDFDYGDTNLPYTDSSDWPVFAVAAPPVKWYAVLLGNYYCALTEGWQHIIQSDCEIIVEKLNFTCENDIIEACNYVRRHEGGRPVNWDSFVKAIRNVPSNSILRGLNPYGSAVQCRTDYSASRRLPEMDKVAVMRACEAVRKTLPTPYAVPENTPIATLQGRTLENHLLNEYGTQPCLSNDAGTMYHAALLGDEFVINEYAVKPGATFAEVLAQAEENYFPSVGSDPDKTPADPDQWLLVLDSVPFRSYLESGERMKKFRFAIHLTADGGEVYEGPQALMQFDAGFRPQAIRAAEHPIDWTKTEL